MSFATIQMIAKHAGKHPESVRTALKIAGVKVERFPGVRGGRILERDANKFLLKHWPHVGVLPQVATK